MMRAMMTAMISKRRCDDDSDDFSDDLESRWKKTRKKWLNGDSGPLPFIKKTISF